MGTAKRKPRRNSREKGNSTAAFSARYLLTGFGEASSFFPFAFSFNAKGEMTWTLW